MSLKTLLPKKHRLNRPQSQKTAQNGRPWCQKRRVAYPRLPYLRRGEPMLSDVQVQLVIRPKVTLTDDMSRGLEVPREHTTRCTPHLAGYVTGSMAQ